MKMLAFDTSTAACSVALLNDESITLTHQIAPMQQAKLILPMIRDLLASQTLTLKELDAIAYGCGPGSFTGIRIAASVAQGLGYGAHLPIIQVSSLAVLAETAFLEHQWSKCLVAIDARTEQVYWAIYEINANGHMELKGEEQVSAPDEVKVPHDSLWCGVGDGWGKYAEKLENRLGFTPQAIDISALPSAEALLQLAKVKLNEADWVAPFEAIPVYLR